jgi:hypothetical protein
MIAQAAAGLAANQLLADPQAAARLARSTALRAVGATEGDLNVTITQGIPPLVLATVALAIGGILAVRYLPERWQTKIRRFGK